MPGDQMFLCSIPVFANIVTILTGMSNSLGGEGRVIYVWEIFTMIIETNKFNFEMSNISSNKYMIQFLFLIYPSACQRQPHRYNTLLEDNHKGR